MVNIKIMNNNKYKNQEWIKCETCGKLSPVGLWNKETHKIFSDDSDKYKGIEPIKIDGTIPKDCFFYCPLCHDINTSEGLEEVN